MTPTRHSFWKGRFGPVIFVAAALLAIAAAGDTQARKAKVNMLKSFVGTAEPNNMVPLSVLYDEEAFADNEEERWDAVGKGQEIIIHTEWAVDVSDGWVTGVFIGHIRNPDTNKVTDLFYNFASQDVGATAGETAPSGVEAGPIGNLISGAFGDIGVNEGRLPVRAFKVVRTDNLPSAERNAIVAACNARANENNSYRITHDYEVFMRVYTRGRRKKDPSFWEAACTCFGQTGCLCNQYGGYGESKIYTLAGQVPITVQCNRPGSNQPEQQQRKPEITNAALEIKTSGQSCPKQARATVKIFGDGKRKVRYRIRHQVDAYSSKWFDGRIKKTEILGGEGYALVAEHKLDRKLGPGDKKFRLQIEGWNKTKWQTVPISCPPLEAKDVDLVIKGSGKGVVCPRDTETEITARTNGPGEIIFHLRPVGGVNSAPYRRTAKREGDAYFARYKAKNTVNADIDKTYEAVVKGGPVSNKAKLKVTCIRPKSGQLTLKKKSGARCNAEALVAIHTNVAGTLPYELECGPGRSWQRSVEAKQANKIGVDKVEFAVKDKERVTCVLRTRLGGQVTPLGGASQTFSCPALTAPRP